jgi:signal transduction histidine kinase
MLIVAVATLDTAVGVQLSISSFYLLPITFGAVLLSTRAGYLLALQAMVFGAAADVILGIRTNPDALALTGLVRLATFSFIVFLIGSLRSAVTRAETAEQASRSFLAAAAHQLRTPIAGVVATAEALSMGPDDRTRDDLTANLVASSTRVGRLISALLLQARADNAESARPERTDLLALCRQQVATGTRPDGVDVTVRADGDPTALVDPAACAEALANVIDNAVQRCHSRVEVLVAPRGDEVAVTVRDDGPGVPTGEEDAIFERFVRLDDRGGVGLGLPIARSLLRRQGGDVVLEDGAFVLLVPPAGVSSERWRSETVETAPPA